MFFIGWREWVSLPLLGIVSLQAKVDTGAKTSCLHARHIQYFFKNGIQMVSFQVYSHRKRTRVNMFCQAPLIDRRVVIDSGGHKELRPVIYTFVRLRDQAWPIEINLSNRNNLTYCMLLGRTALRKDMAVLPQYSFLQKNILHK